MVFVTSPNPSPNENAKLNLSHKLSKTFYAEKRKYFHIDKDTSNVQETIIIVKDPGAKGSPQVKKTVKIG